MVFSDVFIAEQVKAAALPVIARVFLTHGDVFQSHIPEMYKIGNAAVSSTMLDSLSVHVVALMGGTYGWHHVFLAHRAPQFLQQSFAESTWQIFHI
jgi:hypothetical protein